MTDEYTISSDEARRKKNEAKPTNRGTPCPKRNLSGKCHVCLKIDSFGREPKGTPKKEAYLSKKASSSWFMNCLIPSISKDKIWKLEIGSKAGASILDGIQDAEKNWTNLANVKAGKGFTMKIKKMDMDGRNNYDVYKGDICDWDVSEDVLANLPDLSRDKLEEGLIDGELFDNNYMHIKSLKMDETLTIRILPHWNPEKRNTAPLEFVWRHWGYVTKEEVDGKVEFNPLEGFETDEPAEDLPFGGTMDSGMEKSTTDSGNGGEGKKIKRPLCFGSIRHFDGDDEDCNTKCDFFTDCKIKVAKDL